jgi:hypothetical protein
MTKVNGNLKYLALIVFLLTLIWNAATMWHRIGANEEQDASVHPEVRENREDILKIQGDVQHIKEGVDRIEEKLD